MDSAPRDTNAILDQLLAEPAGQADPGQVAPPAESSSATAPQVEVKNEAQPAAKEVAPEAMPPFVRDLLTRMHERDRELAAREKALAAKERGPEKRTWTNSSIKANFREWVQSELGWDPKELARGLMTDALGDKAPAEYRAIDEKLKASGATEALIDELRSKIAKLEEKQAGFDSSSAQAQWRASYDQGLDQYVGGDIESTFPNAARALKTNRTDAMEDIRDIITADAIAKLQRGGTEEPMSYEEAVKAFEYRLGKLQRYQAVAAPGGAVGTQSLSPPAKTLANTQATVPIPPKGDPNDPDERVKAAMHWFNTL